MSALPAALRDALVIIADVAGDSAVCLVGGLAVSARTEPRFTRDVDLAVAVDDDPGAEAVVHAFSSRGWRVAAVVEHDSAGRMATARMQRPTSRGDAAVMVDLLFASSGIEGDIVRAAESLVVMPSLTVRTASVGHLLVMKLLAVDARRQQDGIDIERLLEVATSGDLEQARLAAQDVVARGFGRGRDLVTMLDLAVTKGREAGWLASG